MRAPPSLLLDLTRTIDLVHDLTKSRTLRHFEHDYAFRYAVCYAMLIIVEALQSLPEALRKREPDVSWNTFADLADHLQLHRHHPDPVLIWSIVTGHLIPLQTAAKRLLAEEREFANL